MKIFTYTRSVQNLIKGKKLRNEERESNLLYAIHCLDLIHIAMNFHPDINPETKTGRAFIHVRDTINFHQDISYGNLVMARTMKV